MNNIRNIEEAVKPAYESVSCSVTEVETQGVLCASNSSEDGPLGLSISPYNNGGTL